MMVAESNWMNEKGQNMDNEIQVIETSAIESVERAGIDMQISTAKRYPRDIARSLNEAMSLATLDAEVAAMCCYKIPRAGKLIEGPSVRLAEMVINAWGNNRVQGGVIAENETSVVCRGVYFDLEKNSAISAEVTQRILVKGEDGRNLARGSGVSKAIRNAAFRAIPKAYVNKILEQTKKVALGDAITLKERREKLLKAFSGEFKISDKDIFRHLGVDGIEGIGLRELGHMQGIYTAIRDGMMTTAQFREVDQYGELHEEKPEQKPSSADNARQAAKEAAQNAAGATQSKPATENATEPEKAKRGRSRKQEQEPKPEQASGQEQEPLFQPETKTTVLETMSFPTAKDPDNGEEYYDLDAMDIDMLVSLVGYENLQSEIPAYKNMPGAALRRAIMGAINARGHVDDGGSDDDLPWETPGEQDDLI